MLGKSAESLRGHILNETAVQIQKCQFNVTKKVLPINGVNFYRYFG